MRKDKAGGDQHKDRDDRRERLEKFHRGTDGRHSLKGGQQDETKHLAELDDRAEVVVREYRMTSMEQARMSKANTDSERAIHRPLRPSR